MWLLLVFKLDYSYKVRRGGVRVGCELRLCQGGRVNAGVFRHFSLFSLSYG